METGLLLSDEEGQVELQVLPPGNFSDMVLFEPEVPFVVNISSLGGTDPPGLVLAVRGQISSSGPDLGNPIFTVLDGVDLPAMILEINLEAKTIHIEDGYVS